MLTPWAGQISWVPSAFTGVVGGVPMLAGSVPRWFLR